MDETFGTRLRDRVRALGPLCVGVDPSRDAAGVLGPRGHGRRDGVLLARGPRRGGRHRGRDQATGRVLRTLRLRGVPRARATASSTPATPTSSSWPTRSAATSSSTNEGYAEAWLAERSPLHVDAVTASPYLGVDALAPLFALADEPRAASSCWSRPQTPRVAPMQGARTPDDERVEDVVLRLIAERNRRVDGLGSIGAVSGPPATRPEFDLATLGGPYLVPGVGAQGADVPSTSRGCSPVVLRTRCS